MHDTHSFKTHARHKPPAAPKRATHPQAAALDWPARRHQDPRLRRDRLAQCHPNCPSSAPMAGGAQAGYLPRVGRRRFVRPGFFIASAGLRIDEGVNCFNYKVGSGKMGVCDADSRRPRLLLPRGEELFSTSAGIPFLLTPCSTEYEAIGRPLKEWPYHRPVSVPSGVSESGTSGLPAAIL